MFFAALVTLLVISVVVAVCSSIALAIVKDISLIWSMDLDISGYYLFLNNAS